MDWRAHYNRIQIGTVVQIFNIILEEQFNLSIFVYGENKEVQFHYDILKRQQNMDIRTAARYAVDAYFFFYW